jgi:hypothetical protein
LPPPFPDSKHGANGGSKLPHSMFAACMVCALPGLWQVGTDLPRSTTSRHSCRKRTSTKSRCTPERRFCFMAVAL